MLRFSLAGLLMLTIVHGALYKPTRRLKETISRENGTVVKKIEEVSYTEEGEPVIRGVIEDGPFGGNGGSAWTDGGDIHLNGLPSAVEIRTGARLDAIRVRYGETWSTWRGGSGGDLHACEWGSDDTVIIVQGRAGAEIDEIEFITAGGQICGPFGGGGGDTWTSIHPGCTLEYLSGNYGSRVDSLTIHWTC